MGGGLLGRAVTSLTPGAKLPGSRALVTELGVEPVTVQRATDQLVAAHTDWQRVALGAS